MFLKSNFIKISFYILPLISFYISLYQLNHQYDGHHHGVIFSISEDLLSGKLIYKDFYPHYGISFIIINSLFIKIFFGSIYGTYFFISLTKGITFLFFGLIINKMFDEKIAISSMLIMFFLHPFVGTPFPEYLFFLFILTSFYVLIISKNNPLFFLSGILYSMASLTKDNFTIILFFCIIIFFLSLLFLKYVKKKIFQINIINYYWILGYIIPIIIFFVYLSYNSVFDEYIVQMGLGSLHIKYSCSSSIDLFFIRIFDCGLISLKNLIIISINKIFSEPYWLFFLLILITNMFYIINILFFDKIKILDKKKIIMILIAFLSLTLFSTNFYNLAIQRLFTGVAIGLIVVIYLIQNLKSPVTRYFLYCSFFIFLINGIQFARTPNNPIYPTYETKYHNPSNNLSFLKFKKLSINEWKQLNDFDSAINSISNKCSFIDYSTNLTNDVFYRIILKQKFKILNYIPFAPRNKVFLSMYDKYDNNFYSKLNLEINKKNILIIVDVVSKINLELKANPNLYLLKSIKYHNFGTDFINIYLPINCKIILNKNLL